MDVGAFGLSMHAGADPDVLAAAGSLAEEVGCSTIWVGEHVEIGRAHV